MNSKKIHIQCVCTYVEQQSDIKLDRYVFAYTITIENNSQIPVQLISRHWVIEDANRKIEEIYGEGVVGEQPVINPGEKYTYSSGAILETEMGTMRGRYFMIADSKEEFEIKIPEFILSIPRTLH